MHSADLLQMSLVIHCKAPAAFVCDSLLDHRGFTVVGRAACCFQKVLLLWCATQPSCLKLGY